MENTIELIDGTNVPYENFEPYFEVKTDNGWEIIFETFGRDFIKKHHNLFQEKYNGSIERGMSEFIFEGDYELIMELLDEYPEIKKLFVNSK